MKARRLRNLRVKRVDLVDTPASQDPDSGEGAFVVLYKRAEDMKCKGCGQDMPADAQQCAKCGKLVKAAEAAEGGATVSENVEKLQADLSEREAELAKRAGEIEELKKRAEDAEAKLAKAADEAKLLEFQKRAEQYDKLPIKSDALGGLLKRISEKSPDDLPEIERLLKAANAANAGAFEEIGRGGAVTNTRTATEELFALVEAEIKKAGGKVQFADAAAIVAKSNPELYERSRREAIVTQ